MSARKDLFYMKAALELAAKAREKTYPNPMVGAVIVKGGKIVGRGYHHKAGCDHAEVEAINDAGGKCKGAEMFVTLEPCDHYGRTGPCTKAVIDSGIKRVTVAMKDPNSINSGKGISRLRSAGIKVNIGPLGKEAAWLNRKYIKHITTGMPYVTLKSAASLDGKIAARDGSSKWISSEASRKYARRLREKFNAIVAGINTVITDDPYLLDDKRKGYDVVRVVVDSRLRIPEGCNILKTSQLSPVIVVTTELASGARVAKIAKRPNVEVIVTKSKNSRVPPKALLEELGKMGLVNVLVEGGGEIAGSLFDASLVNEVMFFISPMIIGGDRSSVRGKGAPTITKAAEIKEIEVKRFGRDIFVRGLVCSQGS